MPLSPQPHYTGDLRYPGSFPRCSTDDLSDLCPSHVFITIIVVFRSHRHKPRPQKQNDRVPPPQTACKLNVTSLCLHSPPAMWAGNTVFFLPLFSLFRFVSAPSKDSLILHECIMVTLLCLGLWASLAYRITIRYFLRRSVEFGCACHISQFAAIPFVTTSGKSKWAAVCSWSFLSKFFPVSLACPSLILISTARAHLLMPSLS